MGRKSPTNFLIDLIIIDLLISPAVKKFIGSWKARE